MPKQNQNPLVLVPESTAKLMKSKSGKSKGSFEDLIYCHLYGVVGDWYLSEISENREMAFGFQIINSEPVWEMDNWLTNSSTWGEIPIKQLQELVNEKFLKEKLSNAHWCKIRTGRWPGRKFMGSYEEN